MFRLCKSIKCFAKPYWTFCRNFQVSVLGASNPIGQSVSMLLKEHPLIHRLTMYDVHEQQFGIAMDVSHIPCEPFVEGWTGRMEFALRCSDIVVVTCGKPKKATQSDNELFQENADTIICSLQEVAAHSPDAFVVVVTEPLNSIVPLVSKVLECCDSYDKGKVLGVTGVDTMRAQTWFGAIFRVHPQLVNVPVIGGHSENTIIPLFSHMTPYFDVDNYTATLMTTCIRNVERQVLELKGGTGLSILSTAFATFCTVSAILNALNGLAVQHVAFVANNDYCTKYFSSPIIITAKGISAIMQYKVITELEANYIEESTAQLAKDVYTGESFYRPARDYPRHIKTSTNLRFIKTL